MAAPTLSTPLPLVTPPTLPTLNGVGPSCVALPKGEWPTILDFLMHRFPAVAPAEWMRRMQRGEVCDALGTTIAPTQPYQAYRKIYYYRNLAHEPRIPFVETVLYQDDYLLVVDKPHFLPVTPSGRYLQETLLVRLKNRLGIDTLAPMHRLDRETAGVVVFTLQPSTRDRYQRLFRQKAVFKIYQAIAPFRADLALPMVYRSRLTESASFMKMQETERQGPFNSETALAVLAVSGERALYQLQPTTGQKHQLRVHMAALGIPIENDRIYPCHYPEATPEQQCAQYRHPLQLLAKSLSFTDPITGQARHFSSQGKLSLETTAAPFRCSLTRTLS